MNPSAATHIRQAVQLARDASRPAMFDSCDRSDLDEVMEAVEEELDRPRPNEQTLSSYLNSLARSLRADRVSGDVCLELDCAMREAGLLIDRQH